MTKYGSAYEKARRHFKAECQAINEPCWICRGRLGPIDYTSPYQPGSDQPLRFTLDHETPVSLGGDPVRRSNFRAAHA